MDKLKLQQDNPLLEVLQEAVATELTVSNHYWGRAVYWRNRNLDKLAAMYEKEADEERGHAKLVADRLSFLGNEPEIAPGPVESTEGSLKEQLQQDLDGETAVADQYSKWVRKALDADDFVTQEILTKILRETEEHTDWLQGQLAQIEMLGEQNYLLSWKD